MFSQENIIFIIHSGYSKAQHIGTIQYELFLYMQFCKDLPLLLWQKVHIFRTKGQKESWLLIANSSNNNREKSENENPKKPN